MHNKLILRAYNGQEIAIDQETAKFLAHEAGLIEVTDLDGNVTYHNKSSFANITFEIPPKVYAQIERNASYMDESEREGYIKAKVATYLETGNI